MNKEGSSWKLPPQRNISVSSFAWLRSLLETNCRKLGKMLTSSMGFESEDWNALLHSWNWEKATTWNMKKRLKGILKTYRNSD